MSRFDVRRAAGSIDYYLDVQSDFHTHLATRMMIPLIAAARMINPTRGLHVPLTVEGDAYYLVIPMMAAVPVYMLGKIVKNAANQSREITAAIDFLLQGF